ncbi:DUF6301 family protein [Nocardia brasiliensis]|uniref:DUF6301 family protein n=1 Tax=Nocardia brasiliensis TaxID=37326 RepID=UPI0011B272DB|nr:DUF6301 family protein [Nocardia brasiliensis]
MKFLKNQLKLTLCGFLDESNLDELRQSIGLNASGKATDPIGTELGRRTEQHSKYSTITAMVLTLVRTRSDEYTVTLDAIPGTDCSQWRRLIESSCCSLGFTFQVQQVSAIETDPSARKSAWARSSQFAPTTAEESDVYRPTIEPKPALDPNIYVVPSLRQLGPTDIIDPIKRQRADQVVNRYLRSELATPMNRANLAGILIDPLPLAPLPIPPNRQSVLNADDIVTLARGLRNMIWSWRMDDLLGLGEPTMFWTLESAVPGQLSFDIGAVPGYGYIRGRGNDAELIDIPVATLDAPSNEYSELNDAFDRIATALSAAYGEPTSQAEGPSRWIQWDGVENTLMLEFHPPSVRMAVRLNRDVRIIYGEDEARRRANGSREGEIRGDTR